MQTSEAIAVVIPVYNRRTILQETLPFVVEQTTAPAQLVIVDDGSTDGTAESTERWLSQRQPRFPWQVIRAEHQSAPTARNIGLERVKGVPWITFLDSDDHWPRDFLERATSVLHTHPDTVAAVADRRFRSADGQCFREDDCRDLVKNPLPWFFQHGAGIASSSVLRSEAVVAVGGWMDGSRDADDSILFCDLAMSGTWAHLSGDPVHFNIGSAQAVCETHNLSRRHFNQHITWARIYERIYHKILECHPDTPRKILHKALAQRWYIAGKQFFKKGRFTKSNTCFRRAIHWNPRLVRAWRRLASSNVKSLRHDVGRQRASTG